MKRFWILLFALMMAACSATVDVNTDDLAAPVAVEAPAPPAVPAAPEVATPQAEAAAPEAVSHELPRDIHWFRNSAECRGSYIQAYQSAAAVLDTMVKDKTRGSWAVALDADETVIDNSQYQKERALLGEGWSYESWTEWCRRSEAKALPGAVAFLKHVHDLGGQIAIVTNRDSSVQAETEMVFRNEGIPYDLMLTRQGRNDGEKERRWKAVQDGTAAPGTGPLEIVMWVGDNIKDFPEASQDFRQKGEEAYAEFGTRYILLPNPMYGSWERNPKE